MKISTMVKVTWAVAFRAHKNYNISQEPTEIFKSFLQISIAAVMPMDFILRHSLGKTLKHARKTLIYEF